MKMKLITFRLASTRRVQFARRTGQSLLATRSDQAGSQRGSVMLQPHLRDKEFDGSNRQNAKGNEPARPEEATGGGQIWPYPCAAEPLDQDR